MPAILSTTDTRGISALAEGAEGAPTATLSTPEIDSACWWIDMVPVIEARIKSAAVAIFTIKICTALLSPSQILVKTSPR